MLAPVGLRIVNWWGAQSPYVPDQNLDVLTMLGFIILIGVVVNNAILLVHQALNFMRGASVTEGDSAELMINPVMAYNLTFAVQLAERLRPYHLRWLEEPFIPVDLENPLITTESAVIFPTLTNGKSEYTNRS